MAETLEITLDTKQILTGAAAASAAIKGLTQVTGELNEAITDAFRIGGYKDYLKTVRRFGKGLTDELLVLQLRFGTMKAAIADACAPLAAVFVPVLNDAVAAVTRFASHVGDFFRGMIQGITGRDVLAESAAKAAEQEENLAASAKKSGAAVRRSLMAFDQINRLNGGSGGSGGTSQTEPLPEMNLQPISPQVQALVDKVMALLRPLLEIDFTNLKLALQGLWEQFLQLSSILGSALEGLWLNVLTPFIAWLAESLAPTLTECFSAQLETVTALIEPLIAGISALWEALKPVVDYIGTAVLNAISAWQAAFQKLTAVFQTKSPQITGIFQNIATVFRQVWRVLEPILSLMASIFGSTFDRISSLVASATGHIITSLHGVTGMLAGIFTGNWEQAWEGVQDVVKGAVNGIIELLNSMLSSIGAALNRIVGAANSLSFSLPEWVPVLGGKSFSPGLSYVSVPQIPLLAKGAVLPANNPFMAIVGDQKHGTNIEAPLTTIQQAVGDVMADSIASNMAGHNATVAVLRQILQAVLGIEVGDDVIGAAAERYNRKMAMMKGV